MQKRWTSLTFVRSRNSNETMFTTLRTYSRPTLRGSRVITPICEIPPIRTWFEDKRFQTKTSGTKDYLGQ